MDKKFRTQLAGVKLLVTDFDGVHTDGHVWTDQDGRESVMSSRLDGTGLELLRRLTDVKVFVISKETNPVVSARCRKLQIPCEQAIDRGEGKTEILLRIMREFGCEPREVIYMGDDVNDIHPMETVGMGVAVANARPQVKAVAKYITTAPGGNGAIREVCDLILDAKGVEIKI